MPSLLVSVLSYTFSIFFYCIVLYNRLFYFFCFCCHREVVENYKALKIHKRHEDAQVSCSTCEQILPNENCLLCHVRNVHNSVNVPGPVANDDNSDGNDNSGNSDVYELEEEGSEDDEISTPQYSVSRYTVR